MLSKLRKTYRKPAYNITEKRKKQIKQKDTQKYTEKQRGKRINK